MKICTAIAFVCLFGLGRSERYNGYSMHNINNHTYLISNDSVTYNDAIKNCSKIGFELALFNDNNEYFNVSTYLKSNLNLAMNITGFWIDLNVTNSSTGVSCNWRTEPFLSKGVWYDEDPNGNCMLNSKLQCCARVVWSTSSFESVKDALCTSKFWYMCAPLYKCDDGTRNCSQICIEKDSSYDCGCNTGYALGRDNRLCEDVDECDSSSHGCEHGCNNTAGSYFCTCRSGYVLSPRGKLCDDVNECLHNKGGCQHECDNINGSYTCSCRKGYTLNDMDNKTCSDTDECATVNVCQHHCNNSEGSYTCSCRSGYILASNHSSCFNINECESNSSVCQHDCNNTAGGYECLCRSGYMLDTDNRSCIDVDECAQTPCQPNGTDECDTPNKPCTQTCTNTDGSYACSCEPGYTLETDNTTCVNIDECALTPAPCQHNCTDTEGSFNCSCHAGYSLQTDGRSCSDVDECHLQPSPCEHYCNNNNGSFNCTCRSGFRLQSNRTSCRQIPRKKCPCPPFRKRNQTQSSLLNATTTPLTNLLLNRKNTSRYRITKISVPDNRPTSAAIGYSGVIIASILFACVFLNDAMQLALLSFSVVKDKWKKA